LHGEQLMEARILPVLVHVLEARRRLGVSDVDVGDVDETGDLSFHRNRDVRLAFELGDAAVGRLLALAQHRPGAEPALGGEDRARARPHEEVAAGSSLWMRTGSGRNVRLTLDPAG